MAARTAAADVAEKWRQHDKKFCALELKKNFVTPQRGSRNSTKILRVRIQRC